MLTEVKALSSWSSTLPLPLDPDGRAETDLIQIADIQGLDPVKASVSMASLGSIDGASFGGSKVETRNIVMKLRLNPDWKNWSYEELRQKVIYSYFMPKRPIKLIFTTDNMPPVFISGIIESVEGNIFSKDPDVTVSIICKNPYFTAVDPKIVTDTTIQPGGDSTLVTYDGNIEAGLYLKVSFVAGQTVPTTIAVQIENPSLSYFAVTASVDATKIFEMNTTPLNKYVRNVTVNGGAISNLLSNITVRMGSLWPIFESGNNDVSVITDVGAHNWELQYYERFGGL